MAKRRKNTTKVTRSVPSIEVSKVTPDGVPKAPPAVKADNAMAIPRLPSVWKLSRQALAVLWRRRKLFLSLAAIHAGLSFLLVQSLAGGLNVTGLRTLLEGTNDRLVNGILTFEWLMNDSPVSQNAANGAYDVMLFVLISLVYIWALRQVMAGSTVIRVRDAFYKGAAPLVPVFLVVLMIFVQLLPLLIALGLYNVVLSYGFADSVIAKILWGLPALGLSILSLYMIVPTITAIYIATLPDMAPGAALQSGREVVAGRRWTVLRKQMFLPIALTVLVLVLFVPVLLFAPLAAPWLFFLGTILIVPIIHAYYYVLYRELLP